MSASPGSASRFFDGLSAAPRPATVWITGATLWIAGADGGVLACWPVADVAPVAPPDPDGAVTLAVPGGAARLKLADPALLRALPKPRRRIPVVAVAACMLTAAVVVALALLPFPVVLVPATTERSLGDALVPEFIGPRRICHGAAGQAALEGFLARLAHAGGLAQPVALRVIVAPEVNAFALPGGHIVVLSGLLGNVRDGDELAGVLAHEMAHELHRDPLKRLLRGQLWAVLARLAGAGAAGAGVQVATLGYDRAAEARADATGVALLHRAGLRADGLSRFLQRLQGDAVPAWLTDHPGSAERSRATATSAEGAAPFDPAQWRAVQAMCGP